MASSSLSQDDIDNDFEKNSRRSRIRTARARQINPSLGCRLEGSVAGGGGDECLLLEDAIEDVTASLENDTSPKPLIRTSNSSKDKRPMKLHHVNKSKQQQRDRRKLREKRRSTGVVHVASTESTGGSTTGDDDTNSDVAVAATVASSSTLEMRNSVQNESIANSYRQAREKLAWNDFPGGSSAECCFGASAGAGPSSAPLTHRHLCQLRGSLRRDKSPSDLEADDENDHDSLNQSEETGSGSNVSVCNLSSDLQEPSDRHRRTNDSKHTQRLATPTGVECGLSRAMEENKKLLSLMEEKDRRIHMLEYKVQQLMRDTLTISEEQSRLQKENNTLLRALSKLTKEKAQK